MEVLVVSAGRSKPKIDYYVMVDGVMAHVTDKGVEFLPEDHPVTESPIYIIGGSLPKIPEDLLLEMNDHCIIDHSLLMAPIEFNEVTYEQLVVLQTYIHGSIPLENRVHQLYSLKLLMKMKYHLYIHHKMVS